MHHRVYGLGGHGCAEQKALRVIATDLQQAFALRLGFNALGNDRKPQRTRQPNDRGHDCVRVTIEAEIGYEGVVSENGK